MDLSFYIQLVHTQESLLNDLIQKITDENAQDEIEQKQFVAQIGALCQ